MSVLYLPFVLQGTFMVVDEHLYHSRRLLPRWELIGHPLDTLTVLLALTVPAFFPFNELTMKAYVVLSIFSCLFITKDEFVHARLCHRGEHWLHAVLFVLHPMTFMAGFFLWRRATESGFLKSQCALVGSFMIYQILRTRGRDIIKKS